MQFSKLSLYRSVGATAQRSKGATDVEPRPVTRRLGPFRGVSCGVAFRLHCNLPSATAKFPSGTAAGLLFIFTFFDLPVKLFYFVFMFCDLFFQLFLELFLFFCPLFVAFSQVASTWPLGLEVGRR